MYNSYFIRVYKSKSAPRGRLVNFSEINYLKAIDTRTVKSRNFH